MPSKKTKPPIRFFAPWVIVASVIIGVLLFVIAALVVWYTRPERVVAGPATAAVFVIKEPTATPPRPTSPPAETAAPSPTALPLPPPGEIAVGDYVEITGTGGDGLRLRTEPGLSSEVRLLGQESEVFQVRDGPRDVDGYIWWYLVSPSDATRTGWAVANYIRGVQNP